jgi:hypothetical protein
VANEIGYDNASAGQAIALFPGPNGDAAAPVALSAIHAAGAGETITLVKARVSSVGSATTFLIGLFGVNGSSQPTGSPIYTPVSVATGGTNGLKTQSVSWALSNGVSYVLAVGDVDAICQFASDTQANGTSMDTANTDLTDFVHGSYDGEIICVAGDITTSASNRPNNRSPFSSPIFRSAVIG